jgi:pilus assembly protein CpaC
MNNRWVQFPLVLALLPFACPQAGSAASPGNCGLRIVDCGLSDKRSPIPQSAIRIPQSTSAPGLIVVRVGESKVLRFQWLAKVAIGNPAIAGVNIWSDDRVLINGRAPGRTNLIVRDRSGEWNCQVAVEGDDRPPTPNMEALAAAVRRDLDAAVGVRAIGDTLFLDGEVRSADAKQRAAAIAAAHYGKVQNLLVVREVPAAPDHPRQTAAELVTALNGIFAGGPVTARALDEYTAILEGNVTGEAAERARQVGKELAKGVAVVDYFQNASPRMRQVLVRTRVMDVNTQRARQVGLDWGSITLSGGTVSITQPFRFGQQFAGGVLKQLSPIGAEVHALVEQNAARILSEPNLLVMEGNSGKTLIGGEIPIPIAQGSGGGTSVTVEYKPFGISLGVDVLSIRDDGITLRVRPEVSDLDFSQAVTANGFKIPALRTRRAESVVRIRPGESLAIGGLLQHTESKTTSAIPLLSKIPVLGALFKSRSFQKGESELVILVTPEVMEEKR